jgi:hypothetical protein
MACALVAAILNRRRRIFVRSLAAAFTFTFTTPRARQPADRETSDDAGAGGGEVA